MRRCVLAAVFALAAQLGAAGPIDKEKYVRDSLADAEKLQSQGSWGDAQTRLMKTADFVRLRMRDPRQAITIYQRAAALHAKQFPADGTVGMHPQIADIYEYDLADRAAAAKTWRELHDATQRLPAPTRKDYAAWSRWSQRDYEAELAFLEGGKTYAGPVTAEDLIGFSQTLYFGAGGAATNGDSLGPDLNIYADAAPLSAATRAKLLELPPSHSMFLRTWIFAARLESAEDAQRWLERNDHAGFWRACLLTLAALSDRAASKERIAIARMPDGTPNGFALLGRELAKRQPLPQLPR